MDAAVVDVEALVVAYLMGQPTRPPGTVVATQVPRAKTGEVAFPPRMIRVGRTGGAMFSPAHDRPTILVECWSAGSTAAWALAGWARRAMLALYDTLVEVTVDGAPHAAFLSHRAEGSGPVNLPDPATTMPRYQFMHELQVRGAHD